MQMNWMIKKNFTRTCVAFFQVLLESRKDRSYVLRFIQYGWLVLFHVKGLEKRLRVANLEDFDKLASFVSEYYHSLWTTNNIGFESSQEFFENDKDRKIDR